MKVSAKTKICLVIGDPVDHSLSPIMHNAGFAAIGIDDKFLLAASKVNIKDIKHIPEIMKMMGIRGISLTAPHKIEIIKHLEKNYIDPTAKKIGAVNTLVNENGKIRGFNTDWIGIIKPLGKLTELNGKTALIIGTGGVGRAAAFGLSSKNAKLIIVGQNLKKARDLAEEFGAVAKSQNNLNNLVGIDIIFNATPVGLKARNETPISKELLNNKQIIFDAVYTKGGTRLIREAKEKGAKTIDGLELLLHQGVVQFELFTHQKAPIDAMRKAIS